MTRYEPRIADHIRKYGDEFDIAWKKSTVPFRTIAGLQAAAGLGIALGNSTLRPEMILSYPLFAASAGIIGGAAAVSVHAREKKKLKKIGVLQESLRQSLDEPVDVIRNKRNKRKTTHLRWYGVDKQLEKRGTAKRLRSLLDWCTENEIDSIILGADHLPLSNEEMAKYGVLGKGQGDEIRRHKSRSAQISTRMNDQETALQVLECDIEKAQLLAAKFEANENVDLLKDLLEKLDNQKILELYEADSHDVAITQELAMLIQSHLDSEEDTEHEWRNTDEGGVEYHSYHISSRLESDFILRSRQDGGGLSEDQILPPVAIPQLFGCKTTDDLLNQITEGEYDDFMLLCGAYVTSLRRDRADAQATGTESSSSSPNAVLTTLEKFQDKSARKDVMKRPYRIAKAVAAVGLATAAGIGAGFAGTQGMDAVSHQIAHGSFQTYALDRWQQDHPGESPPEYYQTYTDTEGYFADYLATHPLEDAFENTLEPRYYDAYGTRDSLTAGLVLEYVKRFGLDTDVVDYFNINPSNSWVEALKKKAGDVSELAMYSRRQTSVGDVPGDSNKTLYTITPLNGRSDDGSYWYGGLNPYMEINGSPSNSAGVFFSSPSSTASEELSNSPHERDSSDYYVDVEMSDSLIAHYTSVNLPVTWNGRIVDAAIVDMNEPSREIPLTVERNIKTYEHEVTFTDDIIRKAAVADIQAPKIRYWIKEGEMPTTQVPGVKYPYIGLQEMSVADRQFIEKGVKEALGLDENATNAEVLEAIHDQHGYSYTPFADQGAMDATGLLDHEKGMSKTKTIEQEYRAMLYNAGVIMARLDSMNCNIAAATYILGTSAEDGTAAYATGFRDDGDHLLGMKEAHAWVVDENGEIKDATPAADDDLETPPIEPPAPASGEINQKPSRLPYVLSASAALVLMGMAYRKRHGIKEAYKGAQAARLYKDPRTAQLLDMIQQYKWAQGPIEPVSVKIEPHMLKSLLVEERDGGGIPSADELEDSGRLGSPLTDSDRRILKKMKK